MFRVSLTVSSQVSQTSSNFLIHRTHSLSIDKTVFSFLLPHPQHLFSSRRYALLKVMQHKARFVRRNEKCNSILLPANRDDFVILKENKSRRTVNDKIVSE